MPPRRSYCLALFWITVLAVPAMIYFAAQVETNTQDVHTWLPNGTPSRATYDRFVSLFGHDDDIVVSWEQCVVGDRRLDEFTREVLEHCRDGGCFDRVINGQMILSQLVNEAGFTESAARRRLKNVFFGPDGQTTGAIIQLSDCGRENRKECFAKVAEIATQIEGLEPEQLKIGGSSYFSVQIDNATNKALLFSVPAAALAILISYFCLGSFRLTVITLFVAGFAALASVALVCACGFKINGLLVMMPVLVLVLTLSGGVHLSSYYRKTYANPDIECPIRETMSMGWRPCCLAMLTTSVGIMMLSTSHIEAVRHFAIFSATSLIVALLLLLSLYPALLTLWCPKKRETEKLLEPSRKHWPPVLTTRKNRPSWLATAALGMVVFASPFLVSGLARINTTLRPESMFKPSSTVNQNCTWLNNNFAPLESVEVVASFDQSHPLTDQVLQIGRLQTLLSQHPSVTSAFSFANLCPRIPHGRSLRSITKRTGMNRRLNSQLAQLQDQRILAIDSDQYHWRIRLSVAVADDLGYDQLVAAATENAQAYAANTPSVEDTFVSGIWPLSASGRHQLFTDLASSFVLAFIIITPLIMLILGGFTVGLIAMLPNAFPALLFFGVMGWSGLSVDVGTILTASVGLGIAVDDTLHFLECYVRQRRQLSDRSQAVWKTVSQCSRPMLHTTLICCAGLSVFAASEFIPARQFAIAIVVLLGLALVCDLLLLPALILGPFGEFFDPKPSGKDRESREPGEENSETPDVSPNQDDAPVAKKIQPTPLNEETGNSISRELDSSSRHNASLQGDSHHRTSSRYAA